MKNWKYSEGRKTILVDSPPTQKLKITGTRFATILGFNAWQTAFNSWCEVTKVAKVPFEGNIYTDAGNAIEPKVINYLREKLGTKNLKDPVEYFGNLYPSMKYDFFPDTKIFGGMWDALITKSDGITPRTCIEIKTTKRVEDWVDSPPLYYLAQACLYPYLLGIDDFMITATFLNDMAYANPSDFVVDDLNTKIYSGKVSEQVFVLNGQTYSFAELVKFAEQWYTYYTDGVESPEFDEKKDKDILAILRTAKPENDKEMDSIIEELVKKQALLKKLIEENGIADLEKSIDSLKSAVKANIIEHMPETADKGSYATWEVSKSTPKPKADVDKLIADNMKDYLIESKPTYTLREKKGE